MLYSKTDIFTPTSDMYTLYFYSSKSQGHLHFLDRIEISDDRPILAIDINQHEEASGREGLIFVRAGINTLLKYIHIFKITELPALVNIDRETIGSYKQSTRVQFVPSIMLE
ncbi:MAG: hypothetical protein ACTTJS_08125 [Wolinella sp.]